MGIFHNRFVQHDPSDPDEETTGRVQEAAHPEAPQALQNPSSPPPVGPANITSFLPKEDLLELRRFPSDVMKRVYTRIE